MIRPMNELEASQKWYRRGKTYRANSLAAMGKLYGDTGANFAAVESAVATPTVKPGNEPKGVKRKNRGSECAGNE